MDVTLEMNMKMTGDKDNPAPPMFAEGMDVRAAFKTVLNEIR